MGYRISKYTCICSLYLVLFFTIRPTCLSIFYVGVTLWDMHSWGVLFEYWPGHWLSWRDFSLFSHCEINSEIITRLGHDCFLPNAFQSTSHPTDPTVSALQAIKSFINKCWSTQQNIWVNLDIPSIKILHKWDQVGLGASCKHASTLQQKPGVVPAGEASKWANLLLSFRVNCFDREWFCCLINMCIVAQREYEQISFIRLGTRFSFLLSIEKSRPSFHLVAGQGNTSPNNCKSDSYRKSLLKCLLHNKIH